jgi:hypothetical protein
MRDQTADLRHEITALHATEANLRADVDALRALRGQRLALTRQNIADAGTAWCWARLAQLPAERDVKSVYYQAVELRFAVLSPWYGTAHADLVTIEAASNVFVLTNSGNAPAEAVQIYIHAGTTSITALTLATGSCYLEYNGTITPGTNWVLDTATWSVLNNGVAAWSGLVRGESHAHDGLWVLRPGGNVVTIAFSGGGAGSQALFAFADTWE